MFYLVIINHIKSIEKLFIKNGLLVLYSNENIYIAFFKK